jgi:hypothetical protein
MQALGFQSAAHPWLLTALPDTLLSLAHALIGAVCTDDDGHFKSSSASFAANLPPALDADELPGLGRCRGTSGLGFGQALLQFVHQVGNPRRRRVWRCHRFLAVRW